MLDSALTLATHCYQLYEGATKRERRMFNQGFFTQLYIAADGSVDHAELQEPFVQLMARDEGIAVKRIQRAPAKPEDVLGTDLAPTDGTVTIPALLSRGQKAAERQKQRRQNAVLISFDEKRRTQLTLGSNIELLAVAEGFEPPVGFNQLSLSRRVH